MCAQENKTKNASRDIHRRLRRSSSSQAVCDNIDTNSDVRGIVRLKRSAGTRCLTADGKQHKRASCKCTLREGTKIYQVFFSDVEVCGAEDIARVASTCWCGNNGRLCIAPWFGELVFSSPLPLTHKPVHGAVCDPREGGLRPSKPPLSLFVPRCLAWEG